MAQQKTTRKHYLLRVVLGGIGLAIAGWIATALLVGVFVGIGRGLGQRVVEDRATPTRASVALVQPSATPTVFFVDSLEGTVTVSPHVVVTEAPEIVTATPLPATPTPVPTATLTPVPTPTPIAVTLPVYQLPTTCAVGDCRFDYPSSTVVTIPATAAGQLSAYGVAGMVIVGPGGWTGDGRVGVQGNSFVSLHPAGASDARGPQVEVVTDTLGAATSDAASYFEQARLDEQREDLPVPTPPAGITETFVNPELAAYRLPDTAEGLGVDGVAYFTDQVPGAVFKNMEVTLPVAQRGLSTVILDTFIAQHILPEVGSTAAPAVGSTGRSPTDVVVTFYQAVNERRFPDAWSLLSARFQQGTTYNRWLAGYVTTLSVTDIQAKLVRQDATSATVQVRVRAEDEIDGQSVTRTFGGKWILVWDGASWRMDSSNISSVQEVPPTYTPTPTPTAPTTTTPNPLAYVVRGYYETRPEGANCFAFHYVYQWSDGHYTIVCPKFASTAYDHLIMPRNSTRYYPLPFPQGASRIIVSIASDVAVRVTVPSRGFTFTTDTGNAAPVLSWVKDGNQIPSITIENAWLFLRANIYLNITYDRSP